MKNQHKMRKFCFRKPSYDIFVWGDSTELLKSLSSRDAWYSWKFCEVCCSCGIYGQKLWEMVKLLECVFINLLAKLLA